MCKCFCTVVACRLSSACCDSQSCWHLCLVDVCLNYLVCLLDLFVNPKFASNFTTQISQQTHFGRLSVRHVESYLMFDSSSIITSLFERLGLVVLLIFPLFCGSKTLFCRWKLLKPALCVTHIELVGFGAILMAEYLS